MMIKRTLQTFAAVSIVTAAALGGTAAVSSGATAQPTIVIRHELKGCHAWSANGDAYKATQTMALRRGQSISFTNNDVMPHKLIKTSGPAVTITRTNAGMGMGLKGSFPAPMMARMGSASKVTFSKAGVYKFTTKAGEDYMSGVKTVGEDNVLKLTVTVR